ncbi:hypothetical protein [Cohnella soli]|uniref:DUF4367 domain-containing protein n=1 Tax=Cohnella soli TaxID=425005 RepID=A0ABW0I3P9_9BACL
MNNQADISRVMDTVMTERHPKVSFEEVWRKATLVKSRRTSKRMAWAIVLSVLVAVTAGFTYYTTLNWANSKVTFAPQNDDLSTMLTPLEGFENLLKRSSEKNVGLSESIKIAKFPIRVVSEQPGWTKLESFGKAENPFIYVDLFVSAARERIVVIQSYESSFTASEINKDESSTFQVQYPHGSKILSGFGDDLAVLMDLQKGRYQLALYHKEIEGQQVTAIDLWGYDPDTLKRFAKEYLKAPAQ